MNKQEAARKRWEDPEYREKMRQSKSQYTKKVSDCSEYDEGDTIGVLEYFLDCLKSDCKTIMVVRMDDKINIHRI